MSARALRDAATWLHLSDWRVRLLMAGRQSLFPGVSPDQNAQLRRVIPSAWGRDEAMRARLIGALVEEFPVTVAVLGVGAAENFLDSDPFWAVLSGKCSLVESFSNFVQHCAGASALFDVPVLDSGADFELPVNAASAALDAPIFGDIAAFEMEIARCRRDRPSAWRGLRLLPGVRVFWAEAAVFQTWSDAWSLGTDLAARVAGGFRMKAAARERCGVSRLIEARGDPKEIEVSELDHESAYVLGWLASPRTRDELVERFVAIGIDRKEAPNWIQSWTDEGLIGEQ